MNIGERIAYIMIQLCTTESRHIPSLVFPEEILFFTFVSLYSSVPDQHCG